MAYEVDRWRLHLDHVTLSQNRFCSFPANKLRKSNLILRLYFGNLRKLFSANVDGTYS